MKLTGLLFLVFILAFCRVANAQDKILFRNGDEQVVKILEISPDTLYFTHTTDSAAKQIQRLPSNTVFSVTFQNGNRTLLAQNPTAAYSQLDLYQQGRLEARRNYKATATFAGTFGSMLLFPLAAPVVGTVLTVTKVPVSKIKASQPEFKLQKSYVDGYQKQARNKKLGNAAAGIAAGVGVYATFIAILLSAY